MPRGGPRHKPKPMVEPGALVKVFGDFEDLLMDFKDYEGLSRTSGVDVKGLMHCLGLVEKLLALSPTAEINSQALRKALLEMLRLNPKLNRTKFNGETWVSLRSERLVVVLNHFRRLARDENKANALAKLTPVEYDALGKALAKVPWAEGEESQGSQAPPELVLVEEALPKAASKRHSQPGFTALKNHKPWQRLATG